MVAERTPRKPAIVILEIIVSNLAAPEFPSD